MSVTVNLYSEFDRVRFEASAEDETLLIRSRTAFVTMKLDKAHRGELRKALDELDRNDLLDSPDNIGMP